MEGRYVADRMLWRGLLAGARLKAVERQGDEHVILLDDLRVNCLTIKFAPGTKRLRSKASAGFRDDGRVFLFRNPLRVAWEEAVAWGMNGKVVGRPRRGPPCPPCRHCCTVNPALAQRPVVTGTIAMAQLAGFEASPGRLNWVAFDSVRLPCVLAPSATERIGGMVGLRVALSKDTGGRVLVAVIREDVLAPKLEGTVAAVADKRPLPAYLNAGGE
jgi:hypothetical protein